MYSDCEVIILNGIKFKQEKTKFHQYYRYQSVSFHFVVGKMWLVCYKYNDCNNTNHISNGNPSIQRSSNVYRNQNVNRLVRSSKRLLCVSTKSVHVPAAAHEMSGFIPSQGNTFLSRVVQSTYGSHTGISELDMQN